MSGIGLALLLAAASGSRRHGSRPIDRILIVIAAVTFVPVVYELLLGQVTMLIAAAIYPVRDRDGVRRGIPLGIVLALIPKPMLLPVLLWMLVRRRHALLGTIAAAAAMTLIGVVLMGPDIYRAWVDVLTATGEITRRGNLALTSIDAPAITAILLIATIAAAAWAVLRDDRRGFVAVLLARHCS